MLSRILILAMLSLSFQTVHAGIIGTQQAANAATVQADRALVLATLNRGDISSQLQAQGLDPADALARVATMTDQEVQALASDITNAPAGSDATFAAVVILGAIAWYFWFRK